MLNEDNDCIFDNIENEDKELESILCLKDEKEIFNTKTIKDYIDSQINLKFEAIQKEKLENQKSWKFHPIINNPYSESPGTFFKNIENFLKTHQVENVLIKDIKFCEKGLPQLKQVALIFYKE